MVNLPIHALLAAFMMARSLSLPIVDRPGIDTFIRALQHDGGAQLPPPAPPGNSPPPAAVNNADRTVSPPPDKVRESVEIGKDTFTAIPHDNENHPSFHVWPPVIPNTPPPTSTDVEQAGHIPSAPPAEEHPSVNVTPPPASTNVEQASHIPSASPAEEHPSVNVSPPMTIEEHTPPPPNVEPVKPIPDAHPAVPHQPVHSPPPPPPPPTSPAAQPHTQTVLETEPPRLPKARYPQALVDDLGAHIKNNLPPGHYAELDKFLQAGIEHPGEHVEDVKRAKEVSRSYALGVIENWRDHENGFKTDLARPLIRGHGVHSLSAADVHQAVSVNGEQARSIVSPLPANAPHASTLVRSVTPPHPPVTPVVRPTKRTFSLTELGLKDTDHGNPLMQIPKDPEAAREISDKFKRSHNLLPSPPPAAKRRKVDTKANIAGALNA